MAGDAAGPDGRGTVRAGIAEHTARNGATPIVRHDRRGWVAHLTSEERFDRYGNPADRYRAPGMFGLTLDAYRAEWCRCRDAGWFPWELARRFPEPRAGVAA